MVRLFRAEVYRRTKFVEFPHQATCRLASEGWTLTPEVVDPPKEEPKAYDPNKVNPQDYAIRDKPVRVLVPALPTDSGAFPVGEGGNYAKYEWRLAVPRNGTGEIAHKTTDLAAFKAGKSRDTGMWLSGFACLPGATIDMIGQEYSTSEHEFEYLRQALFGGEKPMVPKHLVRHNRMSVRNGDMYIELTNGCSFGVRSWKNKDALRGGQITCYVFNEIYQLPGLHVYTGHAQNLRAEVGYTRFTSTPDEPWVKVLHNMGHGKHPDWHCSCESNAYCNPATFSLSDFMSDAPDWATIETHAPDIYDLCRRSGLEPGALMSSEKFLISWLGKIGGFVGRVYAFNRTALTFTPDTHPKLWKDYVHARA